MGTPTLPISNNVKEKLIQNLPGEALVIIGLGEATLSQFTPDSLQEVVVLAGAIFGACLITFLAKFISDAAQMLKWVIFPKRPLGRWSYAILCSVQALLYSLGIFSTKIFPSEWTMVAGFFFTGGGVILAFIMANYFN
jgi:hypothetical protein